MSSEEKFKDLLKQKLEAKEFPFNPENWEKASDLIDASRGRKKRIVPFILLCIGIFISGGVCFHFFDTALNPAAQDLAIQSTTEPAVGSDKTTTAAGLEKGTRLAAEPASLKEKELNGETGKNNPSVGTNMATGKPRSGEKIRTEDNKIKMNETRAARSEQSDQNTGQPSATARNTINTNNAVATAQTKATTAQVALKKKPKTNTGDNAPSANDRGNAASQNVVTGGNSAATIKRANSKNKTEAAPTAKPEVVLNPIPEIKQPETVAGTPESSVKTPENTPAPEFSPETPVGSPVAATPTTDPTPETKAEVPVAVVKPDTTQKKTDESPKNIFSVEGGLNYHLAWKDDKGKDANGVNPVIGLNYLRVVTSKIGVSLGAHYTTVGNLGNYSNQTEQKRYSFGNVSAMTVITPVKIHYLYAPLRVTYALNSKNTFGAGYSFGYLLTVNSKVENYTQKLNETSDHRTSETKGYAQGFNSYDSQVSVFYRRKIYADLSANAEFFFGLSDIKDNTFFASKHFERNTGMKFTLIYNIFKR
ncbi:MAG: hypothetical protein V4635_06685 [Bacteroidota bacterium]